MLSFRQAAVAVWMYSGLVVAGALVLSLRYKPVMGDAAYLDTWTGQVHQVEPRPSTQETPDLAMVFPTPTSPKIETWGDRIVLPEGHSCGAVRFAFPAPGTALRMGAATDHQQRSQPSHRERWKDSPK